MPRRGPRRITVIGVGTRRHSRCGPLAMEILRIWEAKQAAERQVNEIAWTIEPAQRANDRDRPLQERVNRLDVGSILPPEPLAPLLRIT